MTKREITSLSLMLMGFYLFGTQVPFYGLALVGSLQSGRFTACAPALIALGFALLLITRSKQITQKIFPMAEENAESEQPRESTAGTQAIAFSVVGLLIAAKGLPSIVGIISLNVLTEGGRTAVLRYIGPMIQVLTGALIFFNSRRLSVLWAKLNK
jgi:hypothetical protein